MRRRSAAGLHFALYLGTADTWQVYDNASRRGPRLAAARFEAMGVHIDDAAAWNILRELGR